MMDLRIFIPNKDEVLFQLGKSNWGYVNDRGTDWAFCNMAVYPTLFNLVVTRGAIPSLSDAVSYLCSARLDTDDREYSDRDKRAIFARAKKLTQDFYRDLHTMGLLSSKFGNVIYQKGLDIGMNIDFEAMLKSYLFNMRATAAVPSVVGIQSAMMHPREWRKPNNHIHNKEKRRQSRGATPYSGKVFWLTNQTRPYASSVGGVWLFGDKHVSDLIEDIKAEHSDTEPITVGIISQMSFDW